jgi:mannose-6-phosphate isomerase
MPSTPDPSSSLLNHLQPGRPRIDEKPWGREIVFAANHRFAGKILEVNGGQRMSLHYHQTKHEIFFVQTGRLILWSGPDRDHMERLPLAAGATIDLPPGTLHRIETLEDSVLLEASSPELDDIVRLEDDFGRHSP